MLLLAAGTAPQSGPRAVLPPSHRAHGRNYAKQSEWPGRPLGDGWTCSCSCIRLLPTVLCHKNAVSVCYISWKKIVKSTLWALFIVCMLKICHNIHYYNHNLLCVRMYSDQSNNISNQSSLQRNFPHSRKGSELNCSRVLKFIFKIKFGAIHSLKLDANDEPGRPGTMERGRRGERGALRRKVFLPAQSLYGRQKTRTYRTLVVVKPVEL